MLSTSMFVISRSSSSLPPSAPLTINSRGRARAITPPPAASTSRSAAAPPTSTSEPAEVAPANPEVVLVRHGETEWTRDGRHTGKSDIPLAERGRRQAEALRPELAGWTFALVLTSPLQRAMETCRLAGYGQAAQTRPDLVEWDYGRYDGLTSKQIAVTEPEWSLWREAGSGGPHFVRHQPGPPQRCGMQRSPQPTTLGLSQWSCCWRPWRSPGRWRPASGYRKPLSD